MWGLEEELENEKKMRYWLEERVRKLEERMWGVEKADWLEENERLLESGELIPEGVD